ncbi:MAG TPA: hypothetical protein VD811_10315 [Desulfuromonadales bacterium]|nr:hypothetical protein [Desulfuromonadales bacterium]
MNKLIFALMAIALLAGCATLEEAYYVDREWGQGQLASWDKQVANPNYKYVGQAPTGMEGVNAEEVMGIYNRTFAEKPAETEIFELGLTSQGVR